MELSQPGQPDAAPESPNVLFGILLLESGGEKAYRNPGNVGGKAGDGMSGYSRIPPLGALMRYLRALAGKAVPIDRRERRWR